MLSCVPVGFFSVAVEFMVGLTQDSSASSQRGKNSPSSSPVIISWDNTGNQDITANHADTFFPFVAAVDE